MADIAWIQSLSDSELFANLKEHGVTTPVTGSTRKILEKKLAKLMGIAVVGSSPASDSGRASAEFDDVEITYDSNDSGNWQDDRLPRRRGRHGNDTFGNSFYMEEVDAKPTAQLRNLRRDELADLQSDIREQEEINRNLAGLEKNGSQSSRTALTVLAILFVIGVFLVISYMTQGESADELLRVPTVKVVPAERAVPADQL
ncbi:hypothetical protein BV898_10686 [Hypsibius exemplaris]|uniref:LEM domain-containing protein n=1 Tax=Hypsibius exemplaris TaxID=2072580 RepID=A0A1W0WIX1_HYPEX|nr:hypothetical protein BV898_10686 [Hypsibius exemplaris]